MRLTYLENGETLQLDPALCKGCRTCIEVCPHAVFRMVGAVSTIVDREACMECGACMRNCSHGAVRVTAGVGCAAAVIGGMLRGTAAECGGACCGPTTADETALPMARAEAARPAVEATKPGCCSSRS